MDETPNLRLPYIMAAQSQKHVTHNEAIRALDAIVQLSVLDRDLAAPPGSPVEGARYIVAASPTGAWSGHVGDIAAYQNGAWAFYEPVEGFIAWVADEDTAVVWNGSAWTALTTGAGGAGSFSTVGINATADATNKLAVAAAATLLSHAGAGHQLKINKATAADTASLLYQDAFSGRAELGLAGDDDFHFKVSPDGSTWKEAIVIDRSSGVVTFPFTSLSGGRPLLTANRTYYVRTDGSDSNTGLVNTSGGAFLTIQKAIDTVAALDLSVYDVTIQVGNGTYTGANVFKTLVGAGKCIIVGNTTTPSNVVISVTGNNAFSGSGWRGSYSLRGLKLTTTTSGMGIYVVGPGATVGIENMDFRACAVSGHLCAKAGAHINIDANYTISGACNRHYFATGSGAYIRGSAKTVTISGTPNFNQAFAWGEELAEVRISGFTWSGSATGKRYDASLNALVSSNGGGASYFPGNAAGTTATGGVRVSGACAQIFQPE